MTPRRSKRELERALEQLDSEGSATSSASSVDLTDEQKAAVREIYRYRYDHGDVLEGVGDGSAGISPAAVRAILEDMDGDRRRRLLETLDGLEA